MSAARTAGTIRRRELVWFLALTGSATVAIAATAAARGGLGSFPALPLAMLVPMLAAFIVQRFVGAGHAFSDLGFRAGRLRYWILAPAAMLVLWIVVFVVSFLVHPSAFVDWSTVARRALNLGNLPPGPKGVAGRLVVAYALTIGVGPVLNLPIFLGEEVGWRAFMTPRLLSLCGKPGLLISGVIWGVWHTPFIMLGLNYPTHPLLGHLIWIPFCIAWGVLLQTVYVLGRSIFPVALCHGLTNQFGMLTASLVIADSRVRELVDGPAGLVALAVIAIPATYCYRHVDFGVAENEREP